MSERNKAKLDEIIKIVGDLPDGDKTAVCMAVGSRVFIDSKDSNMLKVKLFDALTKEGPTSDRLRTTTLLEVAAPSFKTDEGDAEVWCFSGYKFTIRHDADAVMKGRIYCLMERILQAMNPKFTSMPTTYASHVFKYDLISFLDFNYSDKKVTVRKDRLTPDLYDQLAPLVGTIDIPDNVDKIEALIHVTGALADTAVDSLRKWVNQRVDAVSQLVLNPICEDDEDEEIEMSNEDLDDYQKNLTADREDRRLDRTWDDISKDFTAIFPRSCTKPDVKFVQALVECAKSSKPSKIIVGGVGNHNYFGPIIRYVFPDSELVFCDTDPACAKVVEGLGKFINLSVLDVAMDYPKCPVISDAVGARTTGEGHERATHALMKENMHQLYLFDDRISGKRPFVIAKILPPFGFDETLSMRLSDYMDGIKARVELVPRRHGGEAVAWKYKGVEDSLGKRYRKLLVSCSRLEAIRHDVFEHKLVLTEELLRMQVDNWNHFMWKDVVEKARQIDVESLRKKPVEKPAPPPAPVPKRDPVAEMLASRKGKKEEKPHPDNNNTGMVHLLDVPKGEPKKTRREWLPPDQWQEKKRKEREDRKKEEPDYVAPAKTVVPPVSKDTGKSYLRKPVEPSPVASPKAPPRAIAKGDPFATFNPSMSQDSVVRLHPSKRDLSQQDQYQLLIDMKSRHKSMIEDVLIMMYEHGNSMTYAEFKEELQSRCGYDEFEATYAFYLARSMLRQDRLAWTVKENMLFKQTDVLRGRGYYM
jgi:hypothetical protein